MNTLEQEDDLVGAWVKFPENPDTTDPGRYHHIGIDTVISVHPAVLHKAQERWRLFSAPVISGAITGHGSLEQDIASLLGYESSGLYRRDYDPLSAYILEDEESLLHLEVDLSHKIRNKEQVPSPHDFAEELTERYNLESVIALLGASVCSNILTCSRIDRYGNETNAEIDAERTYRAEGIFRQHGFKVSA